MKNEFDFVPTDKICDLLVEEGKSLTCVHSFNVSQNCSLKEQRSIFLKWQTSQNSIKLLPSFYSLCLRFVLVFRR